MTESEMLKAIRARFINSFIQQGKDYFEYELTVTYGVTE